MPRTVADLHEHTAALKDKLSVHLRTMTFGLLAFAAGILGAVLGFGSGATHPNLPRSTAMALVVVMVGLFIVLLLDLVQIVLSIITTDYVINEVELRIEESKATEDDEVYYDYEHWAYRGSEYCFWSKIVLLIITTVSFACVTLIYCVINFKRI